MKRNFSILAAVLLAAVTGCKTSHEVKTDSVVEVKPIKIEPIYARIDIYIKIDRELDSFFDFEESVKPKPAEPVKNETSPSPGTTPNNNSGTNPTSSTAGAQKEGA